MKSTAKEIIENERSLLQVEVHHFPRKNLFATWAATWLVDRYGDELPDEDLRELTQRLQQFWKVSHK